MKLKNFFIYGFVAVILGCFSNLALGGPSTLLIYRDFAHKGDENQVRGVIRAYRNKIEPLDVQEFNVGEENKLLSYLKTVANQEEKPLVLAVGEKTVFSFSNLLPLKDAITVHLCHMITSHHADLIGKVNFLALPVHAIGDFEKQVERTSTKLIKTVGVSHNRQIPKIEHVYNVNKEKVPQSDAYLGVLLAGDASTPENKMLLFTEENARELAWYVVKVLKGRHLLITNGPRTGKHHLQSFEEIKSAHRDGQLDYVTKAFINELEKFNLVSNKHFTLFDFQFSSVPNQDMDLILGAIRATHSFMLVPGESTSAISECIDVLYPGSTLVYDNSAMNEAHKAHVKSELEAGRIKHLIEGFKDLSLLDSHEKEQTTIKHNSAAEIIATELAK